MRLARAAPAVSRRTGIRATSLRAWRLPAAGISSGVFSLLAGRDPAHILPRTARPFRRSSRRSAISVLWIFPRRGRRVRAAFRQLGQRSRQVPSSPLSAPVARRSHLSSGHVARLTAGNHVVFGPRGEAMGHERPTQRTRQATLRAGAVRVGEHVPAPGTQADAAMPQRAKSRIARSPTRGPMARPPRPAALGLPVPRWTARCARPLWACASRPGAAPRRTLPAAGATP